MQEIWKNRERSRAARPLTTVSYGGIHNDTPLTQFAGGTVADRVNIEVPFVGLTGLRLLAMLLGEESDLGREAYRAIKELDNALPHVPYSLQQFSRLPAVEIYNKFMVDESIRVPLEFVNFPPDYHIRQIFNGGIFNDPGALEELYEKTSQYFMN